MRGDHGAAGRIDHRRQLLDAVHAELVLLEAEDEHVAVLRVDLHSRQDEEVVFLRQGAAFGVVPEVVVLGEADAVEARRFR